MRFLKGSKYFLSFMIATFLFTSVFTVADMFSGNIAVAFAAEDDDTGDDTPGDGSTGDTSSGDSSSSGDTQTTDNGNGGDGGNGGSEDPTPTNTAQTSTTDDANTDGTENSTNTDGTNTDGTDGNTSDNTDNEDGNADDTNTGGDNTDTNTDTDTDGDDAVVNSGKDIEEYSIEEIKSMNPATRLFKVLKDSLLHFSEMDRDEIILSLLDGYGNLEDIKDKADKGEYKNALVRNDEYMDKYERGEVPTCYVYKKDEKTGKLLKIGKCPNGTEIVEEIEGED